MLRTCATFLFLAMSAACWAQAWPAAKSIRVIVPFAAGGTADVMGRLVAQRLGPLYGNQLVVENRPGSGGHVGAEVAARAPADGYTIVIGTIGIHAAYGIYSKLAYEPAKDLQPVVLMGEVPCVLVVNPSVPARTVAEFLALAKAKPGEINFGSALTDLLGGQIQAMFENLPTLPQHVASGKVRALGVTSRTRSAALPEVPTVAEGGVPDYESTAWFTVAAPRGVPAPVVQKLNADLNAFLSAPEMQSRWRELGFTVLGGSPEAAAKYFSAETEKWNGVIRAARIKAD
jgi:tripartite-type tricarboxylate transporter receptor subunit TctC